MISTEPKEPFVSNEWVELRDGSLLARSKIIRLVNVGDMVDGLGWMVHAEGMPYSSVSQAVVDTLLGKPAYQVPAGGKKTGIKLQDVIALNQPSVDAALDRLSASIYTND